jgi:hypothetical protein
MDMSSMRRTTISRVLAARRKTLLLLVCAGSTAALAIVATASAQTPPATLTGEIFTISAPTVTATCDSTGSTVRYTVSGAAIGPYPGTYTESGTLTIGPETLPKFVDGYQAGPITSATINFSVDSPAGQVTGTKSLPAITSDAYGLCYSPALGGGSFVELCACNSPLNYTATINTPTGQFGDRGISGLTLDQVQGTVLTNTFFHEVIEQTNTFMESFTSSLLVPFLLCDENSQTNQNQGGNGQGCANP